MEHSTNPAFGASPKHEIELTVFQMMRDLDVILHDAMNDLIGALLLENEQTAVKAAVIKAGAPDTTFKIMLNLRLHISR